MRILEKKGRSRAGICMLIYGTFGVGKTRSVLTLDGKTAYIKTEPRDPELVLGKKTENIDIYSPNDFDDIMDTHNQWYQEASEGKFPYQNIFLDSASFWMAEQRLRFEDDRLDERISDKRVNGEKLVDRFHLVDADWGGLSSMMQRLTAMMTRLAEFGINIIWTATVTENPKFNRALSAAPAFIGRAFPNVLNGFFDFIGYITQIWSVQEDGTILPPRVSFISPDEAFTAKCCSEALAKKGTGYLNYSKIFKVIKESE